jgi:hypothetical protein
LWNVGFGGEAAAPQVTNTKLRTTIITSPGRVLLNKVLLLEEIDVLRLADATVDGLGSNLRVGWPE